MNNDEWKKMKIDHIGYLVKNMEKSIEEFQKLGYSIEVASLYDSDRDVTICFMRNDAYRIELVSPCSEKSVVYEQLKRVGNSPYHICYRVTDIDYTLREFREKKYVIIKQPQAAIAFIGKKVAFIYHKNVGMVELVEDKYE